MTETPILRTTITREPFMDGHLEIHTKIHNGHVVQRAFTLASLAEVMGIPDSTMEGKYARAKLHYWKVDIQTGMGRPKRGFMLHQLNEVVDILRTPRAYVKWAPNAEHVVANPRATGVELVPSYDHGNPTTPVYTLQSIADHFGVSTTTVRNKLRKSKLYRFLIALRSGVEGGRPRMAMPASRMGDVKMALEENAVFGSELDRLMVSPTEREGNKDYATRNTVAHYPPSGLQRFDDETLAAHVPAGVKRKVAEMPQDVIDMLNDAVSFAGDVVTVDIVPIPAAPVNTVNEIVEDEAHTIARNAWVFFRDGFIAAEDDIDPEEMQAAIEQMDLDKGAAERFKREVTEGRDAK